MTKLENDREDNFMEHLALSVRRGLCRDARHWFKATGCCLGPFAPFVPNRAFESSSGCLKISIANANAPRAGNCIACGH